MERGWCSGWQVLLRVFSQEGSHLMLPLKRWAGHPTPLFQWFHFFSKASHSLQVLEFLRWKISRKFYAEDKDGDMRLCPASHALWAYSGNSCSIVCTVSHDALLLLRTSLRTPEKDPAHVLSKTDRLRGLELRFRNSSWGTFDTILLTCGEKKEASIGQQVELWKKTPFTRAWMSGSRWRAFYLGEYHLAKAATGSRRDFWQTEANNLVCFQEGEAGLREAQKESLWPLSGPCRCRGRKDNSDGI